MPLKWVLHPPSCFIYMKSVLFLSEYEFQVSIHRLKVWSTIWFLYNCDNFVLTTHSCHCVKVELQTAVKLVHRRSLPHCHFSASTLQGMLDHLQFLCSCKHYWAFVISSWTCMRIFWFHLLFTALQCSFCFCFTGFWKIPTYSNCHFLIGFRFFK